MQQQFIIIHAYRHIFIEGIILTNTDFGCGRIPSCDIIAI